MVNSLNGKFQVSTGVESESAAVVIRNWIMATYLRLGGMGRSGRIIRHLLSDLLNNFVRALIVDGSAQNSTALAAEIKAGPEPLRQRPTVFFCGDRRMPGLPAAFKELEIPLEELVCYKTTCSPSNLNGDFAGFLFFSPSAVDCFFTHNASVNQSAVLFAIGETTAKSITKYCNNKVIVAPEPSETALLNEVKIYFEALKISESN